ncbi:MAG TPA: site-2 protease family protein, partial [Candidatus Saccharimonadales bacterium]|nr:site-2 protease family protein [Candidatus Saccharimonadales bacterium]
NPDRVRFDEFGAALVAAAGPLTNLVLAVVGALLLRITPETSAALGNFLAVFIELNVVLAVFNSIPIPPLDGSRVLYAFAPEPLQDIMRQIEPYGLFIVFALVLTGVFMSLLNNIDSAILQFLSQHIV